MTIESLYLQQLINIHTFSFQERNLNKMSANNKFSTSTTTTYLKHLLTPALGQVIYYVSFCGFRNYVHCS